MADLDFLSADLTVNFWWVSFGGDYAGVFGDGAEVLKMESPNPDTAISFGDEITHFGNVIAISDSQSDLGSVRSGTLYLFDDTTGELRHTIRGPNSNIFSRFAHSTEAVGGNLLVNEASNSGSEAGSVYAYSPDDGARLAQIYRNPGNGWGFGGRHRRAPW